MFRAVKIDRAETSSASGVEFDASAQVSSPFISTPPIEDFGATTLAVRLYGPGASNTQAPEGGASEGSRTEGAGARREPPHAPTGEEHAASGPRGKPARPAPDEASKSDKDESKSETKATKDSPAELTPEAIAAMDFKTAMKEMSERSKYINATKDLDKATRDRLEGEKTKLKERMAAAKGGGAPAATGATGATGAPAPTGGGK